MTGHLEDADLDILPNYHEQITASLTSGVLALDKDGAVVTANRAACQHLGVAQQDLRPGVSLESLDAILPKPFVDVLRTVMETHSFAQRQEIVIAQSDGSEKIVGLSAAPLRGPNTFNGAVFLFVDMTERRRLEHAVALSSQLAQIGELTAGVVHELRNPLGVISGMAELLQRRIDSDDPRRKSVDTIAREATSLERLLAQFLGFAKPFQLELAMCRPENIVERAYNLCQPRARKKGIKVHMACGSGMHEIRADFVQLAQAIVNVLNNAIDAVPENGRVSLRAYADKADLVFDITDNGPGIHLRPGEDVFSPFFTKKESGTGLGLAIVSRIVTAHNGTVSYSNLEEGGTRFIVRIPTGKDAFE